MITIVMSIAYLYPNYIEQRLIEPQTITKANRVGILAHQITGATREWVAPLFTPLHSHVQTEARKKLIKS